MKIVLLGSTGKTGMEFITQALEAGHSVVAVVRTPSKLTEKNPNLHIIKGNVTDSEVLARAMVGGDVLVSTLGGTGSSLITNTTKAIITAADKTGLKRVIMMSSFLVESEQLKGFLRLLTDFVMRQIISDKSAGEKLLRESDLDWTIVYATRLTNGQRDPRVRIVPRTEKIGMMYKISRVNVAAWILGSLKDASYIRKSVTISQ